MLGYEIPARFQTTGFSVESSKAKFARSSESTTSAQYGELVLVSHCDTHGRDEGDILISSWEKVKPLTQHQLCKRSDEQSTYMHDRPPPKNVILTISMSLALCVAGSKHSQIRVDSRDPCLLQRFRERFEPPFRFELVRIFAPQCLVPVRGHDRNDDVCPARNHDFSHERPVCGPDRLGQR